MKRTHSAPAGRRGGNKTLRRTIRTAGAALAVLTVCLLSSAGTPAQDPPRSSAMKWAGDCLQDRGRRVKTGERRAAADEFARVVRWRSRGSDYAFAVAVFLDMPEEDWPPDDPVAGCLQKHFDKFPPAGCLEWDGKTHLKAAEHIAMQIKLVGERKKAPPGLLDLFALAHISEAVGLLRAEDEDVKRMVERLGYKQSKDGKVYGRPQDIGAYDTMKGPDGGKAGSVAGVSGFAARCLKIYADIERCIELKQGVRNAYESADRMAKGAKGAAGPHFRAIADTLRQMGRCEACKEGRVTCPECKGKGITNKMCPFCGGDGIVESHRNPDGSQHHSMCRHCDATGILKPNIPCPRCGKTGEAKCEDCKGTGWIKYLPASASVEQVYTRQDCSRCGGGCTQLRYAMWPCPACGGFGFQVVPTGNPSAKLDLSEYAGSE